MIAATDIEQRLRDLIGNIDPADPKGRRRRKILEAARDSFITVGYNKTSIGEIARAAGVAKGTVYLYFAAKIDLLLAAVALEKLEALPAFINIFTGDVPPRERLRLYITGSLQLCRSAPLIARLMAGDEEMATVLADVDPELLQQSTVDRDALLGRMVDEAARPHRWNAIELRDRARVITSLAYLAPHLNAEHIRDGLDVERYATILADLIVDGIHPGGEP